MRKVIKLFLPLAVVITLFSGIIYAVGQQILRQGANDPQIQIAQDLADALQNSTKPQVFPTIDIAKSLAPFVIVYDTSGKVVTSSAVLDGKTPELPSGVLSQSGWHRLLVGHHFTYLVPTNETRITWQPQQDTRIAAVIVAYGKGFVLSGRSLREVENRESQLALEMLGAWLGSEVLTLVTVVLVMVIL